MAKMKRIKTYIQGFDELIEGGFPENSSVLISGSPGTGKTIFSLEYLYNGAKNEKTTGIYFTFEEKKEALFEQGEQFKFKLEKLDKSNKMKIISIGDEDISLTTLDYIQELIVKSNAKRVVIDSISTLAYLTPENTQSINSYHIKRFLYNFITRLNKNTSAQILYVSQKDESISDNIARYLCDGVIDLKYESLGGEFSRNLTVKKMRKTKNDDDLHPLEIKKDKGIIIHTFE